MLGRRIVERKEFGQVEPTLDSFGKPVAESIGPQKLTQLAKSGVQVCWRCYKHTSSAEFDLMRLQFIARTKNQNSSVDLITTRSTKDLRIHRMNQ
jgi:hypothetical protein